MPPELRAYLPADATDVVQIVVIWVVVYLVLRLLRGTVAASILRGAVLLGALAIVLAAVVLRAFHLTVLEEILTALGNVAVIAALVVFQPELRRGLLSLGEKRLFSRFRSSAPGCVDDLCAAAARLAREKKGALFAVERRNLLHHITRTGVAIDGEARSDLLVTIFWPNSPLHDGGVVIRNDRVAAAACIFPLAERRELASALGTRHRAALGLSEESDAVVVVVSEETGRISVAFEGELRPVAPHELKDSLLALLGPEARPRAEPAGAGGRGAGGGAPVKWLRRPFAHAGVKFLALVLAWGLWFVVREDLDDVLETSLRLEVRPVPGCGIEGEATSDTVKVRLRGPRRDMELLSAGNRALVVPVRAEDLTADQLSGVRDVAAEDLVLPDTAGPGTLRIEEIRPPAPQVRLWRVERREIPVRTPEIPSAEDLGVDVERRSWPQKALVRGPADALAKLPWIDSAADRESVRQAVARMGDAPRLQVSLPLTFTNLPARDFVVIEPRSPEVQVDLVRTGGATLELPLRILDDAGAAPRRARVVPGERAWIADGDPPRVVVDLRGNARAVAAATARTVRAWVVLSELPPGADRGEVPIHFADLPPGVALARDGMTAVVEIVR